MCDGNFTSRGESRSGLSLAALMRFPFYGRSEGGSSRPGQATGYQSLWRVFFFPPLPPPLFFFKYKGVWRKERGGEGGRGTFVSAGRGSEGTQTGRLAAPGRSPPGRPALLPILQATISGVKREQVFLLLGKRQISPSPPYTIPQSSLSCRYVEPVSFYFIFLTIVDIYIFLNKENEKNSRKSK